MLLIPPSVLVMISKDKSSVRVTDLHWLSDLHPAALSHPLLYRTKGESIYWLTDRQGDYSTLGYYYRQNRFDWSLFSCKFKPKMPRSLGNIHCLHFWHPRNSQVYHCIIHLLEMLLLRATATTSPPTPSSLSIFNV